MSFVEKRGPHRKTTWILPFLAYCAISIIDYYHFYPDAHTAAVRDLPHLDVEKLSETNQHALESRHGLSDLMTRRPGESDWTAFAKALARPLIEPYIIFQDIANPDMHEIFLRFGKTNDQIQKRYLGRIISDLTQLALLVVAVVLFRRR